MANQEGAYEIPPLNYLTQDLQGAQDFCASKDYASLKCGFATGQEWNQTLSTQCPTCGSLHEAFPASLPAVLTSGEPLTALPVYWQLAKRGLQVACRKCWTNYKLADCQ